VSDYVIQGKLGGDVTVSETTNNWVIPFAVDFDPRGWLVNAGSGGSSGGPEGYTSRARVIPNVAGYYEVSVGARWDVGTTTNNQNNIQITKNGTTVMLLQDLIPTNTGSVANSMGGTKIIYLNGTTDYINATAYTSNSGGQTLKADDGNSTWFSVHLIAYGPGVTGPTGDSGGSTLWSQNPAVSTVDMSGQALTGWSYIRNTAGLDLSGTSISGLTTLNGQPVSSIGGSTWSTFRATQTVDMSGQGLSNASFIQNTNGLDISGTSIAGVTTLNGQAISSIGGSTWSTFRAIQTVDMSLNGLCNLSQETYAARTSTFAPTELANCQLWFDAADSTRVDLSGSNIIRLRDKSGNGNDASLNGLLNIIYGPTINGRNSIQFSSNDSSRFRTATITSSSNQRTAFYAGRWVPWALAQTTLPGGFFLQIQPLAGTAATCNVFFGLQRNSDTTISYNAGAGAGFGIGGFLGGGNSGYSSSNTLLGWMMDMSGTGQRFMSFNGTLSSAGGTFGNGMATSSAFDVGPTMRGFYLGEVIMYNGALTQANYQRVEGYLAWKWGITLPAGHPHVAAPPTGTTVPMIQSFGTATTDLFGNLQLAGSNSVRTGTLRYLQAISEVGPTLTLTSNESGMNYRFSNAGLTGITVPTTLTSNDAGTFWTLYNPFTSSLALTLTGTTSIPSPVRINSTSTYTIRWTGSNYFGSQDKDFQFSSTQTGIMTTVPRAGVLNNALSTAVGALDVSGQVYGRLPLYVVSTTSLDISANFAQYANTYVYITNSGFNTITNPATTLTSQGGTFFQFKNATPNFLSVTMANTVTVASPVVIPPSNAVTLVVSPTTANTFLLF
jgi:hypothetical protein